MITAEISKMDFNILIQLKIIINVGIITGIAHNMKNHLSHMELYLDIHFLKCAIYDRRYPIHCSYRIPNPPEVLESSHLPTTKKDIFKNTKKFLVCIIFSSKVTWYIRTSGDNTAAFEICILFYSIVN